jgi:hypothetical protein
MSLTLHAFASLPIKKIKTTPESEDIIEKRQHLHFFALF